MQGNFVILSFLPCSGVLQEADDADAASIVQLVDLEESLETPYVPPCTKLIEEYMQHRFKLSI